MRRQRNVNRSKGHDKRTLAENGFTYFGSICAVWIARDIGAIRSPRNVSVPRSHQREARPLPGPDDDGGSGFRIYAFRMRQLTNRTMSPSKTRTRQKYGRFSLIYLTLPHDIVQVCFLVAQLTLFGRPTSRFSLSDRGGKTVRLGGAGKGKGTRAWTVNVSMNSRVSWGLGPLDAAC
jgi:hypothetical protein